MSSFLLGPILHTHQFLRVINHVYCVVHIVPVRLDAQPNPYLCSKPALSVDWKQECW